MDCFQVLVLLERHLVAVQELAQALLADPDPADGVVGQVLAQLADAPVGEGPARLLGALLGRLDDERLVLSRYPAGTATRPLRVQGGHPHVVEAVDHLPHPVGRGLHQPSDHLHGVAPGRGQHHHGAPVADHAHLGLAPASTHDSLQLPPFLIAEATDLHPLAHLPKVVSPTSGVVDPNRAKDGGQGTRT